jgi:hypothetical protein
MGRFPGSDSLFVRDPETVERWTIRIAVPTAFVAAVLAAILLPHTKPLPAVALGSRWILYALRALALFYGFLLFFVPLVRAIRGVLPIELSFRGARWQEENAARDAFDALDERSEVMEEQVDELWEALTSALSRIGALETAALGRRPPRSRGS